MENIYVVQGSTGEYSDHQEWLVKAFVSEEKAKQFVIALDQEANRIKERYSDYCEWEWPDKEDPTDPERDNKLDPQFKWDYTGTNYTYFAVELVKD